MKEISLKGGGYVIVDDADYTTLSAYIWHNANGYAHGSVPWRGKRRTIGMHRFLMQPADGFVVDHINGNRLDNRRANLRVCSMPENMRNRGASLFGKHRKYKGAYLVDSSGRKGWFANITVNGKTQFLGRFATQEDAARAYDKAAREHFGEFARLNFPIEAQL